MPLAGDEWWSLLQARRNIRDVAEDLNVDPSGKTQEELWDEIVRRITNRGEGVGTMRPPPRRRESPPFRWAVRRAPG